MIPLSVCIPTYNRATYLPALLDSLVEGRETIHVAVSDNASTDETPEIIEHYKTILPLTYSRNDTNIGPDRNYIRAAELSQSEYTLICGSDDVFPPGAITKIIEALGKKPDTLVYNRMECDENMKPLRHCSYLRRELPKRRYAFEAGADTALARYFDDCLNLGGLYSYLSSVVIRTERWRQARIPEQMIGTAYPHVYVFLEALKAGACLDYDPEALVLCRLGNDTFATRDPLDRALLDVRGYGLLADLCLGGEAAMAFRRVLFRDQMWHRDTLIDAVAMRSATTAGKWTEYLTALGAIQPLPQRFQIASAIPLPALRLMRRLWRLLKGAQRGGR